MDSSIKTKNIPQGPETSENMETEEAPLRQASEPIKSDTSRSEEGTAPSDTEEENLLKSPVTPGFSRQLDEAMKKINGLKVKTKLTGAQRKRALRKRLEEQGIPWDPKKWRPNKKANEKKVGETPKGGAKCSHSGRSTPTSKQVKRPKPEQSTSAQENKETYKDSLTSIKMALVSEEYPDNKLNEELAEKQSGP